MSDVKGRGIDLRHAAFGLHRIEVSRVGHHESEATVGVNLTQTFGRSWGKILVNEVEGPCVRTQSARGRTFDLEVRECSRGGLLVERLGTNDSDLIFPDPQWAATDLGWH